MYRLWVIVLFVLVAVSFSGGQQTSPSAPPPAADTQPARVKVYAVGPDVTVPVLLPLNLPPLPTEKCKKKEDGKVVLSILVDATGKPRNLMFLHPLGTDLDKFALQIAAADHFKPGMHEGAPVVVGQSVEVSMQACVVEKKDDAGKKSYWWRLRSEPVQKLGFLSQPPEEAVLTSDTISWDDAGGSAPRIEKVGGGVSSPTLLKFVETEFTDAAREAKYQGKCQISLIVDAQGMPRNIQVVKKLDYGLTENAVATVNRYRFKPAMNDGMPVPVRINVEVNFHLY